MNTPGVGLFPPEDHDRPRQDAPGETDQDHAVTPSEGAAQEPADFAAAAAEAEADTDFDAEPVAEGESSLVGEFSVLVGELSVVPPGEPVASGCVVVGAAVVGGVVVGLVVVGDVSLGDGSGLVDPDAGGLVVDGFVVVGLVVVVGFVVVVGLVVGFVVVGLVVGRGPLWSLGFSGSGAPRFGPSTVPSIEP
jgi:hypothetical protein